MEKRSILFDQLQLAWLAKEAARRNVSLSVVVRLSIEAEMRRANTRRVPDTMRVAAE